LNHGKILVKTILIVDDDAVTARAYRNSLEREGYEVTVASDGHAGLDLVQQLSPDAVLLDLMMPKLGGIELLKCIRALPHIGNLPVIVYTNAFIPGLVEQAKLAGASQTFSKGTLTPQMLIHAFHLALK
jgi:CheY-like chemotaxis protein